MSRFLLYLALLFSILVSYGAKAQKLTPQIDTIPVVFDTKCHPGVLWTGWRVTHIVFEKVTIKTYSKNWVELDTDKCPVNQYFVHLVPNNSSRKKVKKNDE